jgi:predicted metalloendopeptidase
LGENIADTGGLSIAFNAYQEMVSAGRSGQPEALLPGPEFSHLTPEQLFFISYGISFCTVSPPQPPGYYVRIDYLRQHLYGTYSF